jgi:hypothetical protein
VASDGLTPQEQELAEFVATGEQPGQSSPPPPPQGLAPSALSGWAALTYATDTVLVAGLVRADKMLRLANLGGSRG